MKHLTIKQIILENSFGGLYIYFSDFSSEEVFYCISIANEELDIVCKNSDEYKVINRYNEFESVFNLKSFLELENYVNEDVFDGYEFLIYFKNRDGIFKELYLMNPNLSKSKEIQRIVSFIENEIMLKFL